MGYYGRPSSRVWPGVVAAGLLAISGFTVSALVAAATIGSPPAQPPTGVVGSPAAGPPPDAQPITGPHRPVPRFGAGPFGSLRSTGFDYAALTFDDGPDPRWTPAVLAVLAQHRVQASFCVIGQRAAAYPELIRAIVAGGHTLCNHTWDHNLQLGSWPESEIRDDLLRTNAAIRAAAPHAPISYYRQPGGIWTPQVVAVAAELGMTSLHWGVDPQDWQEPGARAIVEMVAAATRPGAIVLLHDGGGERSGTVEAVRRLLPDLTDRVVLKAMPPGIDLSGRPGLEYPAEPGQR